MLPAQSLMQLAVEGLLKRHLLFSLKNSPPEISLLNKTENVNYSNRIAVNDKNYVGETFAAFVDFLQTAKVFPINFKVLF